MKISLTSPNLDKKTNTCLMLGVYDDNTLSDSAKALDKLTDGTISSILTNCNFKGKDGETLPVLNLPGMSNTSALLVGFGKKDDLSVVNFQKNLKSGFNALIKLGCKKATCYLDEIVVKQQTVTDNIKQIVIATWESVYRFDIFKSKKNDDVKLKELEINLSDSLQEAAAETALDHGLAIAHGIFLSKNLGNTPSNICTPSFLAEQAEELSKEYKTLNVDVLGEDKMHELGMGAILGVSQGSAEEAKMICMEYNGGKDGDAPIVFVGKGVTFDTGGNSIKPADNMVGMKYDMCGAATVFGVIKAACEMNLPINIVGVVAAVENMPGGTAYKPEDILTSMSGQTIEVISTDAEGRLALCDALTYVEKYKPKAVVDIATLTGAVVIALGVHTTGLVSNNDKLAKALLDAGQTSGDRAWQLPMFDEYQEQLKSPFADMSNVGGRPAGTITAGCFLSKFAKKYDWAHLDIAGTGAMMMSGSDRYSTGRPVPMLMQYLINMTGVK